MFLTFYQIERTIDMGRCSVETTQNHKFYMLIDTTTMKIMEQPTKYLKLMAYNNNSPNSIRQCAFSLRYYFDFLCLNDKSTEEVVAMKYSEQSEHFVLFLNWLKSGKHTEKNSFPSNNSCNAYLEGVFRFYSFISTEYNYKNLHVLEQRSATIVNDVGVQIGKTIQTFRGYLPAEERHGQSISKSTLLDAINACTNRRDQLILLLLAETGFRIGELLGIRYDEDIDYEHHTISVRFRADNKNFVRAKNRENRRALISDESFELMLLYMSENRKLLKDGSYLFINILGKNAGSPLTTSSVYSFLRRIRKKLGVKKITPHMLRHYFANERRKSGWDLALIKTALGHKQLATTEKYLDITDDELLVAANKYYANTSTLYNISELL